MHAIICQGNGQYYLSAVFGWYLDRDGYDDYRDYWIVWNPQKKRLIRWPTFRQGNQGMTKQILIVEADRSNWKLNEKGEGCVDFLNKDLLKSFLDQQFQPQDILERCRFIDAGYVYKSIHELKNQQDINNLDWAIGNFHDAYIEEKKLQDDEKLYLKFAGIWGCKLEVWFWGDLEYDTSSRNSEFADPYWFGATIILQDGFVYLIDDEDMTVEEITADYCYFKAHHMKCRIIPN